MITSIKDLFALKPLADIAAFFGLTEADLTKLIMSEEEMMAAMKKDSPVVCSVAMALGLSATAGAVDITQRAHSLRDSIGKVEAALGAKGESAVLGAISGLQAAKTTGDAAVKRVEELEAKDRKQRVEAALSAAYNEKRITKAQLDDADPKGLRARGMADPDWLAYDLANRSPIAALSVDFVEPARGNTNTGESGRVDVAGRKYEQLSYVERDLLSKQDPETFTKMRADWTRRGQPLPATA